jgi:lipoprotein-anchoring transpeptidase ErfK/SrfK
MRPSLRFSLLLAASAALALLGVYTSFSASRSQDTSAAASPHVTSTVPTQRAHTRDGTLYAIAHLKGPVTLYDRPGGRAVSHVGILSDMGQKRVFGVVSLQQGWDQVLDTSVVNKPAWVKAADVRLTFTRVDLEASLSRRTLTVRINGRPQRTFTIGIGSAQSPTPTGRFAVVDKLPGARFSPVYGCCILGLSGHQTHLAPGWRGGDRLAIHGTDAPWSIGEAASNGCLHASEADMRYLMATVPFGAPLFIHA